MKLSTHEIRTVALAYHPFSPLILSHRVDVLPHQLNALYGVYETYHRCSSPIPHKVGGLLRVGFPLNALVADETGLGKTIILGFLILSLMLRGLVRNVAIIVPKAIVGQWQDELLYKFGIFFRTIEHGSEFLELIDDLKHGRGLKFIVSVDLIKGRYGYEFLSALPKRGLDLTVIDEAHHIITHKETLRSEVGTELANKSKALILSSATPFRGYYEAEYKRILELLGTNFLYIRRFKDQVVGVDGKPLFPKRVSYTVNITLNPHWYQAYFKIRKYIETSALQNLAKLVLLKRLSSSLYALYVTLRKLQISEVIDPFSEETDDVSGVEPDVREKLHKHIKHPDRVVQVASDLVSAYVTREELTPKEQEFLRLLEPLAERGKVVVFTEYRATLDRLKEVLSRADIKFVYVHGEMGLKERRSAIATFWDDPKVKVFLATDAAGEGINLQVARYQINYDIPWSPLKLEQRFGRIHRYGQKDLTYVYNLAIKDTIDGYILEKIVSKLDNVVRLLGDWVFDYVGIAVRPEEVRKTVLEGSNIIDEGLLIKRFKALREETHNPSCDADYIYRQMKMLKEYVDKYIKTGQVDVLEVLRITGLTLQNLNGVGNYPKEGLGDIVVSVYKVHNYIASFMFIERKGEVFLSPIDNVYVDRDKAEQYLLRRTEEIARFYGFEDGNVDFYTFDMG